MATSAGMQEVRWWLSIMKELALIPNIRDDNMNVDAEQVKSPSNSSLPYAMLITDNQSAYAMFRNDVQHSRTKHIDIRHHFIRETIKLGEVKMKWVESKHQLADLLTKPVEKQTFIQLRQKVMGGM